jgi:large subunit ribosomal protein L25
LTLPPGVDLAVDPETLVVNVILAPTAAQLDADSETGAAESATEESDES